MALFHPFRCLGAVTDAVPFAVQRRGRSTFVTTAAGKYWQLYNCAKLTLLFVGGPVERSITALASKNDFTFAAYGPHVAVFRRAHRIGTWRGTGDDVVALLPLGDLVLSLSRDGQLTAFSTADFEAPAFPAVQLPPGVVPTCMAHPDAYVNKVLVGSADGRVGLLNFVAGTLVHTFSGFGAAVRCIAPSPALDVVALGLADGRCVLLNVRYEETLATLVHDAAGGAVTAAAFRTGPGPATLVCGGTNGTVSVWDLASKRLTCVIKEAHDAQVLALHFFVGEPVLMSSGGDNSVKQWIFDADDGTARLLRFRSGHAAPPVVVRFYGESGTRFLSAGADRAFRVFSTIQDQQSRELSQRNVAHRAKKLRIAEEELKLPPVVGVASCQLRERDWCNVVTAHAGAPSAYTWRLADGALGEHVLTPPRSSGATVTAVAISACGHYALLGSAAGDVDRFNLQSGIHRGGFVRRAGDDAAARAVTDGGARAAASSNVAAPATMLDLGATSAGDATDRDRVAAQPPAQVVKPGKPPPFWALAGPRRETDAGAPAHGGAVTLVDADACNARVISAGLDGQLCVWSFRARRLLHTLPVGGIPERGATHRSAALLALACTDRSARVFDIGASPPRRVRTFAAHGDALTDLTFSDDARWLLTACLDGATRVWDVPAGRLLQSLRLGGAPVTALALSPDMDTLTTAHAGKRGIYMWANRLVYSAGGEAELAPPPAEGAPPLDVRAPAVGDGMRGRRAARRGWGARGDGDESDVSDEEDGGVEEDEDEDDNGVAPAGVAQLVEAERGGAPLPAARHGAVLPPPLPQVAPQLVTLALLPRAQWMALLHLETLRERGRPEAPPKKPETAPFFLPTLATLAPHPVFDTAPAGGTENGSTGSKREHVAASRVLREGRGGGGTSAARSPLLRAIAAGAARTPCDYAAAVAHLASAGPSALDAELRSLTLASPDAASLADDDADALAALLDFLAAELATGRAFELLHATLAATLRVHGDALAAHPNLRSRAVALRDAAGDAWARLDKRFQEARCVLAFLAGLGQA